MSIEPKNKLLSGKICMITGCGKGLGKATLIAFAEAGAEAVYANDIVEGSIDETAMELQSRYETKVITMYHDVGNFESNKKAILKIKHDYGKLDVLVNNAGVMKDALIGSVTDDLVKWTYGINVFGSMDLLQLSTKLMLRQRQGSIINLSSIVGITGNPGQLVYSSTKGAIIAMTKTAAKELAPRGIRVNAIAPGMIDTDMMRSVGEKHLSMHLKNIPMGRLGKPEEIANAAVFLASDMASYISGQILAVDGCVLV